MDDEAKGYVLAVAEDSEFYIPGALHVERDDSVMICDHDEDAAKAAELDGVKLIHGMEYVPDGVYLDTPENRAMILAGLEKYPEYKEVPLLGKISDEGSAPDMGMCLGKG